MSIGYACLNVGVPQTQLKTCRKANATEERLTALIAHNLAAVEHMIDYNIQNNIFLYRISSDIIPFGSDLAVNNLPWDKTFAPIFKRISEKIRRHHVRVSMHPGQYTVLNSPNAEVVARAVVDLEYHNRFLDALQVPLSHKIILHIGGVYGDKSQAMARFITQYQLLSLAVKKRLIIENDDRLYTIGDVLAISSATGAPVVYDNLHNAINPTDSRKSDAYWVEQAGLTWQAADGRPKVHYSQQRINAKPGAHTQTIYIAPFLRFYYEVQPYDVDIMLEVKDKNLSAVKTILATTEQPQISRLENEWGRYKYLILERSPANYLAIRQILKNKAAYPVVSFYQLLETALEEMPAAQIRVNAADHVWGHVKSQATTKEKQTYQRYREKFLQEEISGKRIKNYLRLLAEKYADAYLQQSLYFEFD